MQSQIEILVALSQADSESSLLRERISAIPQELERQRAELKTQLQLLEDVERKLDESQQERRALERESDLAKGRRRELEVQQFRVRNNAEYQALTREVEEMRRRASEFEDRGLDLLTGEETAQSEVARLREVVAAERKRFDEVRARLDSELADRQLLLSRADAQRQELVDRLDPATRQKYGRIHANKGDMAVVGVAQGACGGCFYQLPPQRLNEVRKGANIVLCESCGRILVWRG